MQEHHVTRVCGVVFLWMTHEVALPCARLYSSQQCRLQHSSEHYISMKLPFSVPAYTLYSSVDYSTAVNITSTWSCPPLHLPTVYSCVDYSTAVNITSTWSCPPLHLPTVYSCVDYSTAVNITSTWSCPPLHLPTVYSCVDYSTATSITSTLLLNTVVRCTKLTTHASGQKWQRKKISIQRQQTK